MNTTDSFSISALKMLLSTISIVIILPFVEDFTDISFYVTVSVYVLGKFIDLVAKISERNTKSFHNIYIIGVIIGIITVSMCFYAFASISADCSLTLAFNHCLLVLISGFFFIDIVDFMYSIMKLSYTKKALRQF